MKKVIFVFIILIGLGIAIVSFGTNIPTTEVKIYFTDAQVLKLIPVRTQIPKLTSEQQAKIVIKELIKGHDDNLKIKRTIPDIDGCMSVTVKNNIAYVDIKQSMIENHSDGRDIELLTVYSIVNSLINIEGISNVRFTINGKSQKDFMGYLDMRETFIPDYMI